MSNIYKGEFQDYEGNVVYPHTSADVVFATDGQTIQKKLNDAEIDYTDVKAQLTSGEHEFRFGITADGEYGYHKEVEGADTVVPFKSGLKLYQSDVTKDTDYALPDELLNKEFIVIPKSCSFYCAVWGGNNQGGANFNPKITKEGNLLSLTGVTATTSSNIPNGGGCSVSATMTVDIYYY